MELSIPQGIVFSAEDNDTPIDARILLDLGIKLETGCKFRFFNCRTKNYDVRYLVLEIEAVSLEKDYVYVKTLHKSIFDRSWKESQLHTKPL